MTNQGRILRLDPETGAVRPRRARAAGRRAGSSRSIIAAAFSDDGAVQAYSVSRKSSNLYLFRGL